MRYNGRLPYTAHNGQKLHADNHMSVWNVAFLPEGYVESTHGEIGQTSQKFSGPRPVLEISRLYTIASILGHCKKLSPIALIYV